MEHWQIDNTGPLSCPNLWWKCERVFQQLHDWHNATCWIGDPHNWSPCFTQVRHVNADTTTHFWKLQRRINRSSNWIHVVRRLNNETWHQFTTTRPPSIQKTWCGWLVTLVNHFIGQTQGQRFITRSIIQCIHRNTIDVSFNVILAIICFQRILVIELERRHKWLEVKVFAFKVSIQFFNKR